MRSPPSRRSNRDRDCTPTIDSSVANRVIVIDNAGIAEQGTHDELVAADGLYASQLRAGEKATYGRRLTPRLWGDVGHGRP